MFKKSQEVIERALEVIGQNLERKDWFAIILGLLLGAVYLVTSGAAVGNAFFMAALLTIAVFLLMYGSDWVIKGASAIGQLAGMTLFAVGVIFVSLGTTLPELTTNLTSISPSVNNIDFAIGNAVGSYTFNTLAIVGLASMCVLLPFFGERFKAWQKRRRAKKLGEKFVAVEYSAKPAEVDVPPQAATKTWFAMGFAALLFVLCFDGVLSWIDGGILVVFLVGWMFYVAYDMRRGQKGQAPLENEYKLLTKEERSKKIVGAIFVMVAGSLALFFGAKFLVFSSAGLAKMAGFSDAIIGLTIVAMGTSAPEFFVSVTAVAKKRYALGIGNIIGADILDILMVLGVSAIVRTLVMGQGIPFGKNAAIDVCVALAGMFLLWLVLAVIKPRYKLSWQKGLILFLPYVVYVLYLLWRDGVINIFR